MKGHMQDGKFHPHTQSKGIRKSRDPKEKPDGVKLHLKKHVEGIRLKRYARTTGFPKKSTGLNKVEVIELKKTGRKGGSYDPKLFQVNVNGKGAFFPANKALAIQQAKDMIASAKVHDKSGVKVNQ